MIGLVSIEGLLWITKALSTGVIRAFDGKIPQFPFRLPPKIVQMIQGNQAREESGEILWASLVATHVWRYSKNFRQRSGRTWFGRWWKTPTRPHNDKTMIKHCFRRSPPSNRVGMIKQCFRWTTWSSQASKERYNGGHACQPWQPQRKREGGVGGMSYLTACEEAGDSLDSSLYPSLPLDPFRSLSIPLGRAPLAQGPQRMRLRVGSSGAGAKAQRTAGAGGSMVVRSCRHPDSAQILPVNSTAFTQTTVAVRMTPLQVDDQSAEAISRQRQSVLILAPLAEKIY